MKIKSIKACVIGSDKQGSGEGARRAPWTQCTEIANPMSRYPRFKAQRSLWMPGWKTAACVVTAEDGTWGLGTTSLGEPVTAIINDHFAPLLAGENCMATEKLWDMMTRMASPYSAAGLASYAISAVDLALWDLKGKLLGRPVYELIGGPARDRIQCYATGNDTDWVMELGFKATKIACPHGPADGVEGLDKNEALVAKTREIIGPSVDLMLDCWMAFDLEFAIRMTERLRPYTLKWLEDCLIPEDLQGFVEMRRRVPWQGLATGEHWYALHPFLHAVSNRLVDILQPDVMWCGGLTATLKINAMAEAAGIGVIPHGGLNDAFGQHVCYALPNVPWGEYVIGTAPGVPISEGVSRNPGHMEYAKDGYLVPSDAPGFGMEVSLEDLEALTC